MHQQEIILYSIRYAARLCAVAAMTAPRGGRYLKVIQADFAAALSMSVSHIIFSSPRRSRR